MEQKLKALLVKLRMPTAEWLRIEAKREKRATSNHIAYLLEQHVAAEAARAARELE